MKISLIILFMSALHFATFAQNNTPDKNRLPEGTWVLTKCEIRKDSAGTVSAVSYNPQKEREYFRWSIFPTLTFGSDKTCSVKMHGNVHDGVWSLSAGSLVMDFAMFIATYGYSRESESALLLTRRHYLYNESNPERGFMDIKLYYAKK